MKKPRESLADKAYRAIEELILDAELAPGAWIAETAIAERVGLGRTPVREAIQRLARHHLVEIATGRGLRVTDIDVREQLLVIELRREIELLLVRRAARWATPSERDALRALGAALGREQDAAAVLRLDREFKLVLQGCAKHHFAAEAIQPLWSISHRFFWVYRTAGDVAQVARSLGHLIRAIVAGDVPAAEAATRERMDHLDRFARATLERRPGPADA